MLNLTPEWADVKPPVAAVLLAPRLIDLSFAVRGVRAGAGEVGIAGFMALPGAWSAVFDLAALAICGGVSSSCSTPC